MSEYRVVRTLSDQGEDARVSPSSDWFEEARYGLFVHWGLYSLLAHEMGEWVLFKSKLNRDEYNRLAGVFTGSRFDADALAALALRAGMKYLVLTTRHHDGFCLFDTKTTAFNSVQTAAGRDFVREYVGACRRAGLRVGLYYSIMSWQHDAIYNGPSANPQGWERMVQETHDQLRELMSHYGQIDMLWYDGAVIPGIQDSGMLTRFWRSREMNAMIRELQPGILINDRSGLPEDFSTPEQHFSPSAPGRRCEACMTINQTWGYNIHDRRFKSPETIVKTLIRCSRFDSNLLLNIGPRADGTVQEECIAPLETVGRWLQHNGAAIYGSSRCAYTEAEHVAGPITRRGGKLYVHLNNPDVDTVVLDGVGAVSEARVLGAGATLRLEPAQGDAVVISGIRKDFFQLGHAVLELSPTTSLRQPARLLGGGDELRIEAGNAPVLGDDPDRVAPPKAVVLSGSALGDLLKGESSHEVSEDWTPGWLNWQLFTSRNTGRLSLELAVPCAGIYDLDLGVISRGADAIAYSLDGKPLGKPEAPHNPGCPDTKSLTGLRLPKGLIRLDLESAGEFALYALRLTPVLRQLPTEYWQVIGPFPTAYGPQEPISTVRTAMEKTLTAQEEFVPGKSYEGAGAKPVCWSTCDRREGDYSDYGVNFPWRVGTGHSGVCLARTMIDCPESRRAIIMVGCDWWVNVYVNGSLVHSHRSSEACEKDGAQFSTWKPAPAEIDLQAGENVVLVKCHPGSNANWFSFRISDPGDLAFRR